MAIWPKFRRTSKTEVTQGQESPVCLREDLPIFLWSRHKKNPINDASFSPANPGQEEGDSPQDMGKPGYFHPPPGYSRSIHEWEELTCWLAIVWYHQNSLVVM